MAWSEWNKKRKIILILSIFYVTLLILNFAINPAGVQYGWDYFLYIFPPLYYTFLFALPILIFVYTEKKSTKCIAAGIFIFMFINQSFYIYDDYVYLLDTRNSIKVSYTEEEIFNKNIGYYEEKRFSQDIFLFPYIAVPVNFLKVLLSNASFGF